MKRVDQILAGFAEGDAISHEATLLRDAFRAAAMTSDIYAPADRVAPSMQGQCRALDE